MVLVMVICRDADTGTVVFPCNVGTVIPPLASRSVTPIRVAVQIGMRCVLADTMIVLHDAGVMIPRVIPQRVTGAVIPLRAIPNKKKLSILSTSHVLGGRITDSNARDGSEMKMGCV
ncbi:hypothetical protein Hanom_Chr11g01002471 [Helianthus anomalus]